MTADRWERVRALFDSTLGQPPDRRAAFLSTASDGDETIRREVESLLAAHEAAGGFLETPAFRVTAETPSAMKPGDRVGRFEVIDLLGRGGMGEVYRARDASLGRDVAIKVLPRTLAGDPQRLARFDRESRILARSIIRTLPPSIASSKSGICAFSSWSSSKGRRSPSACRQEHCRQTRRSRSGGSLPVPSKRRTSEGSFIAT